MSCIKKLLITGASGEVGTALRRRLQGRYQFRLLCLDDALVPPPEEEVVIADLADLEAVVAAGADVDAILHLGGVGPNREYTQPQYDQMILHTNIVGTYNVFESARINKVKAVVFASTNGVTGMYEKEGMFCSPDLPVRPRDFNSVSKTFGEAMGRQYHEEHALSVFCIRIGDFQDTDQANRNAASGLSRWLSPGDMAELTACCLEASHPQFGIFYGVSKGGHKKWDISNAREQVGWEPRDRGDC